MQTTCKNCGEQCAVIESKTRKGYNSESFDSFFVSDCCCSGFDVEDKNERK